MMTRPRIAIKRGAASDLFGRELPRSASAPMIICVVCHRTANPDKDRPALCTDCGADLPAARGFVVGLVLATERRVEQTMDAVESLGVLPWLADDCSIVPNPHAAPEMAERLAAYHTARIANDPRAAQVEALARAGGENTFLALIRLWLNYQEAGERYAEIGAWVKRCEEALQ